LDVVGCWYLKQVLASHPRPLVRLVSSRQVGRLINQPTQMAVPLLMESSNTVDRFVVARPKPLGCGAHF
jgi:hypothetical protein